MKLGTVLMCLVVALVAFGQTQGDKEAVGCAIVKGAIYDASHLKPGMTRLDLERSFTRDGGLSTPQAGRYVYRRCQMIKVQVTFKLEQERAESPKDTILSISQPYLEYPFSD